MGYHCGNIDICVSCGAVQEALMLCSNSNQTYIYTAGGNMYLLGVDHCSKACSSVCATLCYITEQLH
jgi:hypothetical protein